MAAKNNRASDAGQAAALPSSAATSASTPTVQPNHVQSEEGPAFKAFQWCNPYDRRGSLPRFAAPELACKTLDVANGVRTIVALLSQEDIDAEAGFFDEAAPKARRLLPAQDRFSLERLAMASLDMLAHAAESIVQDWEASLSEGGGQ